MFLSVADIKLAKLLGKNGMLMPYRTVYAARKAKCPVPAACAMLMMETSGGRNVFGHDPTHHIGGDVTEATYKDYLRQRGPGGRGGMQGVGPCQLTWYTYQDWADSRGGCWKPLCNMAVGFTLLRSLILRYGIPAGFAAYNGQGPAARAYGQRAEVIYDRFDRLVRSASK